MTTALALASGVSCGRDDIMTRSRLVAPSAITMSLVAASPIQVSR